MPTIANIMHPLPDIIEPRWWSGTPALQPESFTIDCSCYQMDEANLRNSIALANGDC